MANNLYTVAGRLEVGIQINGVPYPLDSLNLLLFLQIGWTTRTKVPTCHFALSDVQHTMDVISLQDGIPITITIKPYGQDTRIYNFRKFHHEKSFNGVNFIYEVDGYLDNPMFWSGTATGSIQGTSSTVMNRIATACGMTYDGITTSDNQTWLPSNLTYGEWASSVTKRGYSGAQSYMVSGVDPTGPGKLIYKDVNNLPDPTTKMVFGQFQEGYIACTQYRPYANSGMGNKFQGYQHTRHDQSALVTATPQPIDQLQYVPDVSGYYLNTSVAKDMGQGYRSYGGIDVGNTHTNYEQAIYQNQRFSSLFSLGVEFLCLTPTNLTLLDKFTFSVDTDTQKTDVAYAGTYTVGAMALYIQGATYAEKVLGIRMGTAQTYVSG